MLVYQRVVENQKKRTKKSENVVGGPVFGAHPSSNRPVGRQHFLQRLRTCSANYLTSTSQIGENYLELYQPHIPYVNPPVLKIWRPEGLKY